MNGITHQADGSYHWDCPIDTDYHRESGKKGLWGILFLCAFVFFISCIVSPGAFDLRIPLIVNGVILAVSLPLLFLWNSAEDPHEQYVMTEEYVKSGYGRAAVFAEFKKTNEAGISGKYIEMSGKYGTSRIYVSPEDMDFVREYILKRLPEDALIRHI